MDVLVTGGAGYVGSTVVSALLDRGHRAVILDDLSTGHERFAGDRAFYRGDIADRDLVVGILEENPLISVVIHCAARAVAPESTLDPIAYYRANVAKTLDLVETLLLAGRPRLVVSSSASVYRSDHGAMVDESSELSPQSPYARTKLVVEHMLEDICGATGLRGVALRYFNPIGADPHMRTGPRLDTSTHVLAQLVRAAVEGRPFQLTGTDFPTRDGTGLRDYVHVWDLARAHVEAVERFDTVLDRRTYRAINLGSGRGTTVLELVHAFQEVTGRSIDVVPAPRRPGDPAGAFASGGRARRELGWRPERSVSDGIQDALTWSGMNGGFAARIGDSRSQAANAT